MGYIGGQEVKNLTVIGSPQGGGSLLPVTTKYIFIQNGFTW